MPSFFGFIVYIPLAGIVVAALHFYSWVRLVRDTRVAGLARHVATAGVAGLAVLLLLAGPLGRLLPSIAAPLAWPAAIWLGLVLNLTAILFAIDGLRLLAAVTGRRHHARRLLLPLRGLLAARILACAVLAGACAVTLAAVRKARGPIGDGRPGKIATEMFEAVSIFGAHPHVGVNIETGDLRASLPYDCGLGILASASQAQHATTPAGTRRNQALHGGIGQMVEGQLLVLVFPRELRGRSERPSYPVPADVAAWRV